MAHIDLTYSLLFLTGLTAGTVDAIAGGGGLISLPMLLSLGIPPHIALGTNKFQSSIGTSIATWRYYRQGWISLRLASLGLMTSFVGAGLGSFASQSISNDFLKKIIPMLLLAILFYTLLTPKNWGHEQSPKWSSSLFYSLFGLLLGFYDGFFGPGVGSFWVFLLIFFLGYSLTKATAYTKVFNLNTNLVALCCFAACHNIDYRVGFIMAAGQLFGGRFGAHLAIKKGAALIRPMFIIVVTSTILVLCYKNYFANQTSPWKFFVVSAILVSLIILKFWHVNRRLA